jgi:hypothetical protein
VKPDFVGKQWVLQVAPDGHGFWDTYLHPECKHVATETFYDGYTPFNQPVKPREAKP